MSAFFVTSCKKFLDAKTDKKLVVPSTIQDAQAILDNYSTLNTYYYPLGAQSDDDYFLSDTYYNSTDENSRNYYVWYKDAVINNAWNYMYQVIVNANVALETLAKIQPQQSTVNDWKQAKGAALFFRAYAHYQVAQYYASPYDKNIASEKLGIPLRLTSDINEPTVRSSLEETWQQIISDYKEAASLLPVTSSPVSRPSRSAAYAALARTYLDMDDFVSAGKYADSSLQLYNTLLDYNSLNPAASAPFSRFNTEVLFNTVMLGPGALLINNARIDSLLYTSYDLNDLRRSLFFQSNGPGTYGFKGNYDGTSNNAANFNGLAVDEVYLVRAECNARMGNVASAMDDLNTLLIKRWKSGTFVPYTALDAEDALNKILQERRKELLFRGIRWFDLRRLNKDPRFAKTLIRKVNGQLFELPPNDKRYTFFIPESVIALTGIQQNERY
jgi:hypothetical protein